MGSCVIVSSIIHALVFEDRILDYEDVIGIAKQYDERIVPFIDLAYHEGLDSLCLDDEKSMGYTLRTLGAALWAYWHATSYKEGILKIVLSGGDADTNAAVAGAILGAKFGIDQIPEEWKSGLLHASMLHDKVQISTQCIAKNVSLSVVCKSPANGGRFTRIALKSFENYSPNSFSIFFMTLVLMVENSDLS